MTQQATSERAAVPLPHALVVDDDDTYRRLIRAVLESLSWEVDDAWNGQVGWRMFQLSHYDMVVIDIFMPHQEGLETVRCMRTRAPGVPILAISGGGIMGCEGYLEAAERCGAMRSLAKPFRPTALLERGRAKPWHGADAGTTLSTAPDEIRVLVVDDSPVNCLVARAMLEDRGVQVDTAASAEEATAKAAGGGYTLILMDIHLIGSDGYSATRAIRNLGGENREIPILALTAESLPHMREACLAAGMNDVILKPLDKAVLDAALQRWCGLPLETDGAERPESPPAQGPDWQITALAELREALSPASVKTLVGRFLAETKDRVARLQAAGKNGDHGSVREEAHALKSAAALFGVQALADAAKALEAVAALGGEMRPAVQAVSDRAAEACSWLAREIS